MTLVKVGDTQVIIRTSSHYLILLQWIHQALTSGLHGVKRVDMEDMLYIYLTGLETIKVVLLVAVTAIALV